MDKTATTARASVTIRSDVRSLRRGLVMAPADLCARAPVTVSAGCGIEAAPITGVNMLTYKRA